MNLSESFEIEFAGFKWYISEFWSDGYGPGFLTDEELEQFKQYETLMKFERVANMTAGYGAT